ncbi:MAG: tetratricopeptide repeat protein [Planctomycetes bacterium]|nr:tetratricopeptide repeat protein [Planctomycetota bacterium]
MHQVRAEPPSPREAQLAQRLVSLGLLTGDQVRLLWQRRAAGDPRPLEQVLVQDRLVAPDALQRALTPPSTRHETLELPGMASEARRPAAGGWGAAATAPPSPVAPVVRQPAPTARDPGSSASGRVAGLAGSGRLHDTRRGPGSDPLLASSGLTSSLRVQPGQTLQLTQELTVTCERLLGQGGMGTVHLVNDPTLGRRAALKLIKGEGNETRARRFRREVVVTARLDHPGIPPVFLSGRTPGGQDFLLMRFVDGQALDEVLDRLHGRGEGGAMSREGPPPPEPRDLLDALVKVSEALSYAHSRGIVHRDLKPANVMIGAFGEVLLMDWGLARDLAESSQEDVAVRAELAVLDDTSRGLTQDGALLGTPGYMPPEQARGEDVDARADVFALGAVLVEVLTGEPPVTGHTALEVLGKTGQGEVTLPRDRDPTVAPELNAIAARALARAPARRYASAADFGADLKAYLEGRPVSVYRYGTLEQLRRLARRHPAALGGLVGAFLLSLVGVVAVGRARAGAAVAERQAAVARAQVAADEARAAFEGGREQGQDRAIGLALASFQAAQRWRALAHDDRAAAAAAHAAALALGRLAEAAEQWSLAVEAYRQAGGLGVDDAAADEAVARVEAARNAEAERRRAEVDGLLELARTGALSRRSEGLQDAVFKIARYTDPATVALLCARLDRATAALQEFVRREYLAAAEPDEEERRQGEAAIPDLRAALDARPAGRALEPPQAARLSEAERRLERRAARGRAAAAPARLAVLLGARQATAVGGGELDVARLASEALGRIGDAAAGPSLARYLAAELDPLRAIPAAVALLRLGGPEALEPVLAARARFGRASAYGYRIDDVLSWLDTGAAPPIEESTAAAYFRRAEWYEARKDEAAAEADYTRALELDPRMAEAYSRRGNARLNLGKNHEALADFDRAVELAPSDARYVANRSNAKTRLGDWAGAGRDLDRALELDSTHGGMFMNRGLVRAQQGDAEGALADFDRSIELDPDMVHGWINRGLHRMAMGDARGAQADLDHGVALDPRESKAWLARSILRRKEGQLDLAQADLDQAIAVAPEDSYAHELRATVKRDRGDLEGALADLTRALELAPDQATAWKERAEVRRRLRDGQGALQDLDRAIELDPGWPAPRLMRAEMLAEVDPVRAGADAERVLTQGAESSRALLARGKARLAQGDVQGAVADHQRATELAPDDPVAWQGLGAARGAAGDVAGALAAFARSLALAPERADVLADRAALRHQTGDVRGAQEDLEAALRIDPRNPLHWTNRGAMRAEGGDLPGARADLDRALSLAPTFTKAWFNRALLGLRQGVLGEALEDVTRAVELEPNNPSALELRAVIRDASGDVAGAAADAERVLVVAPDRATCWYLRARNAMRQRNPRQAAELCTQALRLPDCPPGALFLRASAREMLGDLPGAIEDLERVLPLVPPGSSEAAQAREALERCRARR